MSLVVPSCADLPGRSPPSPWRPRPRPSPRAPAPPEHLGRGDHRTLSAGTNRVTTDYTGGGISRYLSERDNNGSTAATVSVSTTLTNLVVNRTYNLSFHVASRFGSDDAAVSQRQTLNVSFQATATTATLQYLFTLPALGSGHSSSNDIAISAPMIAGC